MAADTREPETSSTDSPTGTSSSSTDLFSPNKKPRHEFPKSQVGKLWDAFGNPEEPINLMAGGKYNASGKQNEATITDAFKSLSAKDITTFYKAPCARDSLMIGMGAGFGIGGVRGVLGGKMAFKNLFLLEGFWEDFLLLIPYI
jgi:cytochrome c oxidase assembly protein subunit 20